MTGLGTIQSSSMTDIPLPEGYHSVNPYIVVDNAEQIGASRSGWTRLQKPTFHLACSLDECGGLSLFGEAISDRGQPAVKVGAAVSFAFCDEQFGVRDRRGKGDGNVDG